MTTRNLVDAEKAKAIEAALAKLREAANYIHPYYDDPRIRLCLAQLEGLSEGWFYVEQNDPDRVADLLVDLCLEARGTPVADHWRGALTAEEAE
jgi:hypothetical protein